MPACSFCGEKFVEGTGLAVFKRDGSVQRFCSKKCRRNALMKRNPRKLKWTAKYSRA